MTKLTTSLLLAIATASLAGCELYFGDEGDRGGDDRWSYCANDGYYVCQGDDCDYAGQRCPQEPGWSCESDADCAAGCYCGDNGTCEEAGFCGREEDCPDGFHCDVDRASCVPDGCAVSSDCETGEYCDDGRCVSSCTCMTDSEARQAGYGYCDEARGTCEPTPAGGSCGGTSACEVAEPTCPAGQVPLIAEGCYTGECSDIATCDVTPSCEALQHESDCLAANATCTSVYYGINCTRSDGTACQAGDQGCMCETFQFAECRADAMARTVPAQSTNGQQFDVLAR